MFKKDIKKSETFAWNTSDFLLPEILVMEDAEVSILTFCHFLVCDKIALLRY
ncbi:hypothetical protein [Spongiivirga citrea]|uniref:Uncharacterized protein n=1 Tax=Spongiivirga citrea TaxID=1481457 RepID=A0A6M0CPF7_9FLAO|nr:hypothetical protein [Spongiivirga citrea]NER17357.1 hypothetical protein [Spongiivirga citrea]